MKAYVYHLDKLVLVTAVYAADYYLDKPGFRVEYRYERSGE